MNSGLADRDKMDENEDISLNHLWSVKLISCKKVKYV